MAETSIGPYKILRQINKDSVGEVYEAVDRTGIKRFALKYLRPETAAESETVPRLYSEGKTLAQLNHPHIARLFGFVRRSDRLYLVMEFVEGETLEALVKRRGRLEPSVALAFFHQIVSTVGFAHRLGVIHGNLRPAKIMVTKLGLIKILDFGIGPILGTAERASPGVSRGRYMSPEQIRGEPVDARSDIYSLGILLYELIVGKLPFDSDSTDGILRAQIDTTPLPPSALVPNSPKWLDALVKRALAQSPSERFQSATVMLRAMELVIKGNPSSASPERQNLWRQRCVQRITSASNSVSDAGHRAFVSLRKKTIAAIAHSSASVASVRVNVASAFTKRAVAWRQRGDKWVRSVSNVILNTRNRVTESLGKSLASSSHIVWKRYVLMTCLLAVVLVETFYFGGANLPSNFDFKLIPNISLNDAVDTMMERVNQRAATKIDPPIAQAPITADPPAAVEEKPAPPAEPKNPRRKFVAEQPSAASSKTPAEPSRVTIYRPRRSSPSGASLEKPTAVPAATVTNVREASVSVSPPTLPSKTAENDLGKIQLNVKWEN
jgi:serine/threonine protein kinase